MLKIKHLTVGIPGNEPILSEISLVIEKQKIVALLGKNGAGKTTLMVTMMLLHKSFKGEMFFENKPVTKKIIQKKFGYMEADPYFYEYLTVFEMLEYLCLVRRLKNHKDLIVEWLCKVNLADKKDNTVKSLSKGMKQRLSFVMAIIHKPEILLLDEPFNALDPDEMENLKKIIIDYSKQASILISTHIFSFLKNLATDVIFLHIGQIKKTVESIGGKWTLADYEENFKEINV
ncbi:MAG: ABC transporter ATP-binding protein [Streptococcaceae bacterium]|jgi:ABC-2 type transport system ATP-binding protein|nr:ABC transporter ATP-binding protein [Streptococcaceae bacterium]